MGMDALFAVRSVYSEELFYNQVLASKPKASVVEKKKKFNLPEISFQDLCLAAVSFLVFFMAFPNEDMAARILQSLLTAAVFVLIMRKMNGKRKETMAAQGGSESRDREQARMILESADLEGKKFTVMFGEDVFRVDSPGIVTEYRYEGVAWIKETSDYYMIFWNRSLAIPVEKAGFFKGRPDQFRAFIEKKCGKTIERVRNAG